MVRRSGRNADRRRAGGGVVSGRDLGAPCVAEIAATVRVRTDGSLSISLNQPLDVKPKTIFLLDPYRLQILPYDLDQEGSA